MIYVLFSMFQHTAARRRLAWPFICKLCRTKCFNTQPPEGGWCSLRLCCSFFTCFNTQPPEGGWLPYCPQFLNRAGFNTQPPEGGWPLKDSEIAHLLLFQHTAARRRLESETAISVLPEPGFNTQPPEGGWLRSIVFFIQDRLFQHTAARRRLAFKGDIRTPILFSFNTQPPEGGWAVSAMSAPVMAVSTHSRPKAAGRSLPRHNA